MQLPPIEKTLPARSYGAEAAALAISQMMPVNPINPAVKEEPTPSVINLVNMANKPITGEAIYSSVSDPGRRGSEAATSPQDWTIHRPKNENEKVEDPPPVPMHKVLMDYVKSLWTASASAIQIQQVKNELDMSQQNPNAKPYSAPTEVLTYTSGKVNKTESS